MNTTPMIIHDRPPDVERTGEGSGYGDGDGSGYGNGDGYGDGRGDGNGWKVLE